MFKFSTIDFKISERKILLRLFDVLFVILGLYLSNVFLEFKYLTLENISWVFVLVFYLLFFGTIFEMYNLKNSSNQYAIVKSIILTSFFTQVTFLLTPFFTPSLPKNRIEILYFFILIFIGLFIWRFIYLKIFTTNQFNKNVIIISNSKNLRSLIADLKAADPFYNIKAYLNPNSPNNPQLLEISEINLEELQSFIINHKIKEIVIDNHKSSIINVDLYNKLLYFVENGVEVKEYNQVYEDLTNRVPVHHFLKDFYVFFPFSRNNNNKLYNIYVRLFDIIFSILVLSILVVLTPVLLLFNLFANKGSFFYTQERVGENGKVFNIIKLRTMVKDAEAQGAKFAVKNDVRITPFGKLLRKTRLDEVPQVLNVLKGEMSIIGPRPERPIFVDQISKNIPFYNTRHYIKPGLTGWAQVNHNYTDNIDDALIKLQYDLYYIKKRNFFLDVNIIIKTISTVLYFKGQ
jgi:exopolysaccharide biosynthesis polyprenyl glycosylphosphotransferase